MWFRKSRAQRKHNRTDALNASYPSPRRTHRLPLGPHSRQGLTLEPLESRTMLSFSNVLVNDPTYDFQSTSLSDLNQSRYNSHLSVPDLNRYQESLLDNKAYVANTQSETSTITNGNFVWTAYNDSSVFARTYNSNTPNQSSRLGYSRSIDGGATFQTFPNGLPLVDSSENPVSFPGAEFSDPVLARDPNSGTIYLSFLEKPDNAHDKGGNVRIFKSTNDGLTFTKAGLALPDLNLLNPSFSHAYDKDAMAVDSNGTIYVAATDFVVDTLSNYPTGIVLAKSTDGGLNFQPFSNGDADLYLANFLVQSGGGNGGNGLVQGASIAIGSGSSVYVSWFDITNNVLSIKMRASSDSGVNFGHVITAASSIGGYSSQGFTQLTNYSAFRVNSYPIMKANPVYPGQVYAVYLGNSSDLPAAVYFVQSLDSGANWSSPYRVDGDVSNGAWQPTIAVTPDGGKVFIANYHMNDMTNARQITTVGTIAIVNSGGAQFSSATNTPFQISSAFFSEVHAKDSIFKETYMGDYDLADATNDAFYYTWGDNRVTDSVPANPDVRFVRIPVGDVTIGLAAEPGSGHASAWTNTGAVAITDAANAKVTDADNASLTSITATIGTFNANNVLSATANTNVTFSYNGSGMLTLKPTGTFTSASLSDFQNVLRTVTYNNTGGGPHVASVTVSFVSHDGANLSDPAVATVTIDQAPLLDLDTNSPGTRFTSTWNGTGAVNITSQTAATVSDDSNLLASMTATIANPHNGDVLSATNSGNVTFSYNGSGVYTLKPTGSLTSASTTDFQAVLRTIMYNNTLAGPGVRFAWVNIQANDVLLNRAVATAWVTNGLPILDLNGDAEGLDYTAAWDGNNPVRIESPLTATVIDAGSATLTEMTFTISPAHLGDSLGVNVPSGSGITASGIGSNHLILTGSSLIANYQAALRSVTYTNTNGGPSVYSVTINVVAYDGTHTSPTAVATVTTSIPTILLGGNVEDTTPTWVQGGSPIYVTDPSFHQPALVSDNVGSTLASLTATIFNPRAGDILAGTTGASGANVKAVWDGTSVLTLSPITGSSASFGDFQTVLRTITYDNTSGVPGDTPVVVYFQSNDGVSSSTLTEPTIYQGNIRAAYKVTATIQTDDVPVIRLNGVSSSLVTTWNGSTLPITDPVNTNITDPNPSLPLTQITATIESPSPGDVLSATTPGGNNVTWSYNGFSVLTLKPISGTSATQADFQAVLRTVTYNNTDHAPLNNPVSVDFVAFDGYSNFNYLTDVRTPVSSPALGSVALISINAPFPPAVDLNGPDQALVNYSTNWFQGTPVNITDPSATVSDNDSDNLTSMTITIGSPQANDVLTADTNGTAVTASYNSGSGVLTLAPASGPSAPVGDFQTVLQTIKYNNTSPAGPGAGPVTISVVALDDTSPTPLHSQPAVTTIGVNRALSVDLDGGLSGGTGFTSSAWSNAGAVAIAAPSNATVFDGESPNLTSLTVSVVGVHTGDALSSVASFNGVTVAGIGGNTLTLSGTAPVSDYQHVLRTVTYNNTNGGPGVSSVTINFLAHDGTYDSNTATATVPIVNAILDLNGAPAGTGFTSISWLNTMLPFGGNINITDAANATITDIESGTLTSMTVSMTPVHAGDWLSANTFGTSVVASFASGTGILTLSGSDTLAHYQQVLRTVKYTNVSLANGGPIATSVTANVQAKDSLLNFSNVAVASIAVSVAPIVDLNGNAGGLGYTAVWTNIGTPVPVAIVDTGSITAAAGASVIDGRSVNLTQLTATIVPFNANNVLATDTTGTSITATYVPGTGVLTLSGTDTTAHYQTVLRKITYNNTGGGPGAGPIAVNFVGSDGTNSSATAKATIIITTTTAPNVVGRNIFYNKSGFDGGLLAVSAADDAAIASDKVAYIAGTGASTFANVTSYDKGINGIMIDIKGVHGTISAADFIFKVGNSNVPSNASAWTTAGLTPLTVTTRTGAGAGGSDRVEITWDNVGTGTTGFSTIKKEWLEVILKGNDTVGGTAANTNTLLAASDVFFFGNAVGESGNAAGVNATDEINARNNGRGFANPPFVTFNMDYNRDKSVNGTDETLAHNNPTGFGTQLNFITVSGAGPFAPLPGGGSVATWTNTGVVGITVTGDPTVTGGGSTNLVSLTATIASPHGGDVLSADTTGTAITANYNGTDTLTLSGTDTQANYQAVLRTITYDNTNGGPGVASVAINLVGDDGTNLSNTATATVPISVASIVDLDGSVSGDTGFTSATWTNAGAVAITDAANATVTDGESGTLISMAITIANWQAGDVLSATSSGNVQASYDGAGVLTLSAISGTSASLADFQAVLRSIMYDNTAGGPGVDPVTINFVANDGTTISDTATATVSIDLG